MAFQLRAYHAPNFTEERFVIAPQARLTPAPSDGIAPVGCHAMSIFPEYFKIEGSWRFAEESRMDCVAIWEDEKIKVIEFRNLKKGQLVVMGRSEDGSEGIYVHPGAFRHPGEGGHEETFAFRQKRSRETAFSRDYDELYEILKHDREHGKIVWVMEPALAFDYDARDAFSRLIENGYVDALLAGNALATHDLEAAWLKTALGQNIYTQAIQPNGHYKDGIMAHLEKRRVPYVLAGSIRDDGPLPEVTGNVYEAQNKMRDQVRGATTVICLATMLHSIAVGNMTPSYRVMPDGTIREVYFYCVDISEFTANKLGDRGSLSAKGIVTNVQDFIVTLCAGLGI